MRTSQIGIHVVNVGGEKKQNYTLNNIAHSARCQCKLGNEGCIVTDQTPNKGEIILCHDA